MTHLTRRTLLGGVGAVTLTAAVGQRPVAALRAEEDTDSITRWIARHATPLKGVDPELPDDDLTPLLPMVRGAAVVGLGEAAHTTSTFFDLKLRLAPFLIERAGVRTIAWEEAWGSGVLIDRYLTHGIGDPREIAGQATFNLQTESLLHLLKWGRAFNASRPPGDRVRFLGADVLQLRAVQFEEVERYVGEESPGHLARVRRMLAFLRIRTSPGEQIGWFSGLSPTEQATVVRTARHLVRTIHSVVGDDRSARGFEAQMHALTILGFYEAYTPDGRRTDRRDQWIADLLGRWHRRHRTPIAYSASNAHTIAVPHQAVSFPDPNLPEEDWVTERTMAGGLLRRRFGRRYVSIGTSFQHGTLLSGWQEGEVKAYEVPPPVPGFIDHVLDSTGAADYILDLGARPQPAEVRSWLRGTGRQRVYGGAYYDPELDPSFYHEAGRWGRGYDALLHVDRVTAARPLTNGRP